MFVRKAMPRIEWAPLSGAARTRAGRLDLREFGSAPADHNVAAPSTTWQDAEGLDASVTGSAIRPMTMAEAMETVGLPQIDGTPEEELAELLRFAAEIEHGLMAQYLYAVYSAKEGSVAGALKMIAIEEMGHLITVQNLLSAIGAAPWLGRYDWSGSPFAPFPFRLEPASRESIAKYTICEMPEADSPNLSPAQRLLLPDILSDAQRSSNGTSPVRIGLLYAKIYWLLRHDDLPLANADDEPWSGFPVSEFAKNEKMRGRHISDAAFSGGPEKQASIDPWQSDQDTVIVHSIRSRCDALAAISDVVEQGEGFGETPDGHFDQFVQIWELTKNQASIANAVPTDPWYGADDPPGHDLVNKITSPDGMKFAQLSDQLYGLILLANGLYPLLPPSIDPAHRNGVGEASLLLMDKCMKQTGLALTTIERSGTASDLISGMCFRQPAQADLQTPAAVLARIQALIDEAKVTADQIVATTTVLTRRLKAQLIGGSLQDTIKPLFDQVKL